MPTAKECKEFVEAVVNAHDLDSAPAVRKRFAKYRDWFPPDAKNWKRLGVLVVPLFPRSMDSP